jgi:chromate transporter
MTPPVPANSVPTGNGGTRIEISLAELALVFLKLGTIAFGGPAAHISMMEQEFVTRRAWLTREEFLDRLGAANLIPGPSSTEMAIHIGFLKRGWRGLIVAGCCFIVPASIVVTAIAAAYVRYGNLPRVSGILYGLKPVVIAVIAQAFWNLAKSAIKNSFLAVVGILSALASALAVNNLTVILAAGALAAIPAVWRKDWGNVWRKVRAPHASFLAWTFPLHSAVPWFGLAAISANAPVSLWRLFLTFAKIGSVLFGSGYVLLAFLRADFVVHLGWLTERQLLDAVAVGQITPGPVFTTATFIGYLVAGVKGAIVATVAIFLPGFVLVAASGPIVAKVRRSSIASAFLDGVIVASLALMGVVAWQLGRQSLLDVLTVTIFLASLALLLRTRTNPLWIMLAAALVGLWHGA